QGYLDRLHLDVEKPDRVLGTTLEIGAPQVFRSNGEIRYRGRWVRMSIVGVVAQDAAPGEFLVPLHETEADRTRAPGGIADGDRFRLPTSQYSGLVVVANSLDGVHEVRAEIAQLGYATSAPEQLIANVQRYLHLVDIVLAGIAGIALVTA